MTTDPGEGPSAETVSEQLNCARALCQSPEKCWARGGCCRVYRPDTKQGPRLRASGVFRAKVRRERECRVPDCGGVATDGHHLLYRSLGGDDVTENCIPLCHFCHMTLEFDAGPDYWRVREEIGSTLSDAELQYPLHRLGVVEGVSFLQRAYHIEPESFPSAIKERHALALLERERAEAEDAREAAKLLRHFEEEERGSA